MRKTRCTHLTVSALCNIVEHDWLWLFCPLLPYDSSPLLYPCFQLQLYIGSAAMVHLSAVMVYCRHQPFCHPFHKYIEGLVPYRINRVLILLIWFNSYGPRPTTSLI